MSDDNKDEITLKDLLDRFEKLEEKFDKYKLKSQKQINNLKYKLWLTQGANTNRCQVHKNGRTEYYWRSNYTCICYDYAERESEEENSDEEN
jgi:hypothetical protein